MNARDILSADEIPHIHGEDCPADCDWATEAEERAYILAAALRDVEIAEGWESGDIAESHEVASTLDTVECARCERVVDEFDHNGNCTDCAQNLREDGGFRD